MDNTTINSATVTENTASDTRINDMQRSAEEALILAGCEAGIEKGWSREDMTRARKCISLGSRIGLSSVNAAIGAAVKADHRGVAESLRLMARAANFSRVGVADPALRTRR